MWVDFVDEQCVVVVQQVMCGDCCVEQVGCCVGIVDVVGCVFCCDVFEYDFQVWEIVVQWCYYVVDEYFFVVEQVD